ncbi:hypothetical protein W03_22230 [Nitrosomonas sp. PY1]|uniref:NYN domain-containing protein n=1 Tax=Nitrosomonas sp. PY1 TaxID=1803906 RepID=UPI001FC8A5E2|nr:NYN domain-containing protein [Nitrosomonas sp. PY1]GKS70219.1 hypothetical protein W03_22230 [Nitrosomonas sp. PY1]
MEHQKRRVACFVDGFNLYHSIDELRENQKTLHYLKWLDLKKLVNALIIQSKETITDIHYFSAYAVWLPDAVARHKQYVMALKSVGVNIKLGQFKNKSRSCKQCKSEWIGHEEKESDVNFAVELLNRTWKKEFDKAIIITADTDIVPVLQMIKKDHPDLELTAAIPEKRYGKAIALREACHNSMRIKKKHLENSLFSETIVDSTGKILVTCPLKYKQNY